MLNEELKDSLLKMAEQDLQLREALAASGELFGGYNEQMAELHAQNAAALERIIDEYGWPGASLVGDEGTEAAWLVLQHAIGSPALQRKCLPLLKNAADAEEATARQVAYFEDRLCVFEQRPQRYGTQFDWDGHGNLSPRPLEDPDRVDEYRASVGLGSLAEEIRAMRQRAAEEGHCQPEDFEQYLEERDAWARSVGWI